MRRDDVASHHTGDGDSPLLRVADVYLLFDGIVALDAASFDVEAGRIARLVGPNGTGKTTLFNCLPRYAPTRIACFMFLMPMGIDGAIRLGWARIRARPAGQCEGG